MLSQPNLVPKTRSSVRGLPLFTLLFRPNFAGIEFRMHNFSFHTELTALNPIPIDFGFNGRFTSLANQI